MSGQDDMGSRRFAEKRQSADVSKILGLRKKDAVCQNLYYYHHHIL